MTELTESVIYVVGGCGGKCVTEKSLVSAIEKDVHSLG